MLSKLKKYLLKNRQPDCIPCLVQPLVERCLSTPIEVNCPHLGCSNKDKFSRNSTREILSILCFLAVFIAYSCTLYDMLKTIRTVRDYCFALIDITTYANTFTAAFFTVIKLSSFVPHMTRYSNIIDSGRAYFTDNLISEDYLSSILTSMSVFSGVFIFGTVTYGLIKLTVLMDSTCWEFIRVTCFCFCFICAQFQIIQRLVLVALTRHIFNKYYRQIMLELLNVRPMFIRGKKLCQKLKMFQRFYKALIDCLQRDNTLHFETYIISWFVIVIMAISSLFGVLVDILQNDDVWNVQSAILRIYLLATVITILVTLFSLERLATDVSSVG